MNAKLERQQKPNQIYQHLLKNRAVYFKFPKIASKVLIRYI